jgi:hypothetical protein
METVDKLLGSFHGGGKLKQGTSSPDLPHAPIFPNNLVLAPHQAGGSLPQPDAPMGVEPHMPDSPQLPQEAPQEEEARQLSKIEDKQAKEVSTCKLTS